MFGLGLYLKSSEIKSNLKKLALGDVFYSPIPTTLPILEEQVNSRVQEIKELNPKKTYFPPNFLYEYIFPGPPCLVKQISFTLQTPKGLELYDKEELIEDFFSSCGNRLDYIDLLVLAGTLLGLKQLILTCKDPSLQVIQQKQCTLSGCFYTSLQEKNQKSKKEKKLLAHLELATKRRDSLSIGAIKRLLLKKDNSGKKPLLAAVPFVFVLNKIKYLENSQRLNMQKDLAPLLLSPKLPQTKNGPLEETKEQQLDLLDHYFFPGLGELATYISIFGPIPNFRNVLNYFCSFFTSPEEQNLSSLEQEHTTLPKKISLEPERNSLSNHLFSSEVSPENEKASFVKMFTSSNSRKSQIKQEFLKQKKILLVDASSLTPQEQALKEKILQENETFSTLEEKKWKKSVPNFETKTFRLSREEDLFSEPAQIFTNNLENFRPFSRSNSIISLPFSEEDPFFEQIYDQTYSLFRSINHAKNFYTSHFHSLKLLISQELSEVEINNFILDLFSNEAKENFFLQESEGATQEEISFGSTLLSLQETEIYKIKQIFFERDLVIPPEIIPVQSDRVALLGRLDELKENENSIYELSLIYLFFVYSFKKNNLPLNTLYS